MKASVVLPMAPHGELRLVPGLTRSMTYQVLPRDLVTTLFSGAPEFARTPAVLATDTLLALCGWPVIVRCVSFSVRVRTAWASRYACVIKHRCVPGQR
jgi:hypothetical protein